jgi:small basic protein
MNNKLRYLFERYITNKIGTEIKCCLLFFEMACFYWLYRWLHGSEYAGIIHMIEMAMLAYILIWIQVLLHSDFSEVDHLHIKEWLVILTASLIYAVAAYFCQWFDHSIAFSGFFFLYIVCVYLCTFLIYKIKREIDAKHLNEDLRVFQSRNR